jgi:hypothetical protein
MQRCDSFLSFFGARLLWAMRVQEIVSLTIFAANQREQGKNRKNSRRHGKNREFSPARE